MHQNHLRPALPFALALLALYSCLALINPARLSSQLGPLHARHAVREQTSILGQANGITLTVAAEIAGLAGPAPVNCSAPAYVTARAQLDQQRAQWLATAKAQLPGRTALTTGFTPASSTVLTTAYPLRQPDGFVITVTPVDLAPAWGLGSSSSVSGIPAFDQVQINGNPGGCTMQDHAPSPSPIAGGGYYFNQLSNARGLNGILFTFSEPIQAFGAFFGDLETSYRGTTAFLRLWDTHDRVVAELPISSTLGLSGGIGAEVVCDQSEPPTAQVAAQGLAPGCGNGTTRWLGFVAATPIAKALVVVGDNDPLPKGQGLSEKVSVMGATVLRSLPPTEVTISKTAPATTTVGTLFGYTLTVANRGNTLAAGIVVTDPAPAGISFAAVQGAGCALVSNQLTCTVEPLAAGATTTILLQARATITGSLTNTAAVTAANDSAPSNNHAAATLTAVAAPARHACAAALTGGGPPLVINEVLYRQDSTFNDEWVELWSTRALAGGSHYYLSDNEAGIAEFRLVVTIPVGGIPANSYLVLHRISGVDDLDATDGVLHFYGAGGALKLNDDGDNLTLYAGTDATGPVLDYIAYGSGSAIDPGPGWSAPHAHAGAARGQSIVSIHNGADTSSGAQWRLAGTEDSLGPATPGANNGVLHLCNVALTKTGPTTVAVGAPFVYQIAVANTAAVTITGIIVTDTQPPGVLFQHVSGKGCQLAGGGLTCTLGTLAPQARSLITLSAMAHTAGAITNTAYTTAISDAIPSDNQARHPITFQPLGAIGDFVYLDSNRNGSQEAEEQQPLNGVPVTLLYPDGTITTTYTVDGIYRFALLPAGSYTVTVGAATGYTRTSNAMYVVHLAPGALHMTADFGFAYAPANVKVAKTGTPRATLMGVASYTLTLTNASTTTTALDVVLTDTLPSGLTEPQVANARCGWVAPQLICRVGNLAPQATVVITVMTTAATVGDWINHVVIDANNDSDQTDNAAILHTQVNAPTPTVTVTPTATPTPSPSPTATATATDTATPTPAATPTATNTATATLTFTPTDTATATSTPTASATATPSPTATPQPTATATSTGTTTPTPTATPTPTTTPTRTLMPTPSATATQSATTTASPTLTATETATPTTTPSPTATYSPTSSATPTATATETPTTTATTTPTVTPSPSPVNTNTVTPTTTPTVTATATASATTTPITTRTPTTTRAPTMPPIVTPPPTGTDTATPSPTATGTPTSSHTATATATETATVTTTPTPTASATMSATARPTSTPTMTVTAAMTAIPLSTASATPTSTTMPSATATMTATATPPPTATPTVTPSATPVNTNTRTPTTTPTASATPMPTATRTPTMTTTLTPTATVTDTATVTATAIEPFTPTATATATPTGTATNTPWPTATLPATALPHATPTASAIPTATVTATPTESPTATVSPTASPTPRATLLPLPAVDLGLSKSATITQVVPGELITYTLAYHNSGIAPAQQVHLTETVPLYTAFVLTASTPGWRCPDGPQSGASCFLLVGEVQPHEQQTVIYVVKVMTGAAPGVTLINVAQIGTTSVELAARRENNRSSWRLYVTSPAALVEASEPQRLHYQIFLPLLLN